MTIVWSIVSFPHQEQTHHQGPVVVQEGGTPGRNETLEGFCVEEQRNLASSLLDSSGCS